MSRIRHATETFVNHLIDGVKKLISSNTEQINVLSNKKFIKADENTEGRDIPTKPSDYVLGLFTNQIKTVASMGILGGGYAHAIGINEWTDSTAGVHELIFAGQKMYHRESVSADTWGQLHELATTEKTDISLSNGWANYDGVNYPLRAIRTGTLVNVIGRIKDGVFDTGTVIATLPRWGTYKFVKGIVIGLDTAGNKVFEVNVNTNGQITCQGKWASVPYGYVFNFSVDLI